MRFVIIGAGAIGGVVGGRLHQHGAEVALVARGAHLEAMRTRGLRIEDPDASVTVHPPLFATPAEVDWRAGDVAVLAVKGQDTPAALDQLRTVVRTGTAVLCMQNGVDNERQALRVFADVYGVHVMCPATFLEPGVVQADSAPVTGLLDLGRYPGGTDERAAGMAAVLSTATFDSRAVPDILHWKYAKLLANLRNAVEIVCEPGTGDELTRRAKREAVACFAAAGIECASREEDQARRGDLVAIRPVAGRVRGGSSTWQSVARGTGTVETDLLNGEVVVLGRLHGVPTPVNEALQRLAHDVARGVRPPAATSEASLLAEL